MTRVSKDVSYLLGEGGQRLGGEYMWEIYGRGRARACMV